MLEKIKKLREISGAGISDVKKALDQTNGDVDKAFEWLRKNNISKAAKKQERISAEGKIVVNEGNDKLLIFELNSETDFVSSNDKFKDLAKKISDSIINSPLTSKSKLKDILDLKIENDTIESLILNLSGLLGEKINLRRFKIIDTKNLVIAKYIHINNRIATIIAAKDIDLNNLKDIALQITASNPSFIYQNDIPKSIIDHETKIAKELLKDRLKGKPENIVENIIKGKVAKTLSEMVLENQPFLKDESKKISDLLGAAKIELFFRFELGEGIAKKVENFAEEVDKQIKGSN